MSKIIGGPGLMARYASDGRVILNQTEMQDDNLLQLLAALVRPRRAGLVLNERNEFMIIADGAGNFRVDDGLFIVSDGAGGWKVGRVPAGDDRAWTVPLTNTDYNVWLAYSTRNRHLGRVTCTATTAVTGNSYTKFTEQYSVNDGITFEGFPTLTWRVVSITDDQNLTLDVNGPTVTNVYHYPAARYASGYPSGGNKTWLKEFDDYSLTLTADLTLAPADSILLYRIQKRSSGGRIVMVRDYRLANEMVPWSGPVREYPTPIGVTLTTGISAIDNAFIKAQVGFSGTAAVVGVNTVDVSADWTINGVDLAADALAGQWYYEDQNRNLFLIVSHTAGGVLTVNGTPYGASWRIHPNAAVYQGKFDLYESEAAAIANDPPIETIVETYNFGNPPTDPLVLARNIVPGTAVRVRLTCGDTLSWSDISDPALALATGDDYILAGFVNAEPKVPTGLSGSYNDDISTFTAIWSAVTQDVDSAATNIRYYEISWRIIRSINPNVTPDYGSSATVSRVYSTTFVLDIATSYSSDRKVNWVVRAVDYAGQVSDTSAVQETFIPVAAAPTPQ